MPKGKQGGRREFVRLERDRGDYTPFAIQEIWTEREARKEYSRLRNIVVKRLKRIEEVDPEAKILKRWQPDAFKTLKEIKNMRELSHLLSDVAYLVNAKTASLTGREQMKKEAIEELRKQGLDIDTKNLKEFGDFMELVRDFAKDRIYDSERAAELFSEYSETFDKKELLQAYKKWAKRRKQKRPRRVR